MLSRWSKVVQDDYTYWGDTLAIKYLNSINGQEKQVEVYHFKSGTLVSSVHINSLYQVKRSNTVNSQDYNEDLRKYHYDGKNQLFSRITYNPNERGKYVESSKMYYIYKNKVLIGYFPAKDENAVSAIPADSIYYQRKLKELSKIGFQAFSKKYLKGDIYRTIIEDYYKPIKRDEILINGKPINDYLHKTGHSNLEYIILEIFDNSYLFYKLVN